MKVLNSALIAVVICTLAACGNPVRTEADHQADLAGYRTFAWQKPERSEVHDPALDSALLDKRMRVAVTRYLEDQGYVYDEQAPDFLVTYHTTSSEQVPTRGASTEMRMAHYSYRRDGSLIVTPLTPGSAYFESTTMTSDLSQPRSYKEATLILDIIDQESDTLVWRGWQSKRLARKKLDTKTVRKTVEEILAEFPLAS